MADIEISTLTTAGAIQPADYVLVFTASGPKKMPVPQGLAGRIQAKNLVVNATTGLYTFVPSTDIGWRFLAYGVDQQVIEMPNDATAPKDFTYGPLSFQVVRLGNGTVAVAPKTGTPGTGVNIYNNGAFEAVTGVPLTYTCYQGAPNDWYVE